MQLSEDFLHYIWQYRLFTRLDLWCKDGQPLQIIDPGLKNTNAGPDFTLARLKIGRQLWAGNVEIHLKSSDWLDHKHQSDQSYDTVILHAVYEDDLEIYRTDGTVIPVLLLRDIVPAFMAGNYLTLIGAKSFFPCAQQVKDVKQVVINNMLGKMITERFVEKANEIIVKTQHNHHNWNETMYYLLLRNFGFKVNTVPFELLADALPSSLIARYRDQPKQVAALLFGVAGFLERDFNEGYPRQLKTEFLFLQKKHRLKPLHRSLWKFMRIHPQNFPVIRIAQVAALLTGRGQLFSELLNCNNVKEIKALLSCFPADPYWNTHSDFDRICRGNAINLGKHSVENIIINTVCLLWYAYGQYSGQPRLMEKAFALLKTIPSEKNAIVIHYQHSGIQVKDAFASQAVLQLNKKYCVHKKCLDCMIGIDLLGKKR